MIKGVLKQKPTRKGGTKMEKNETKNLPEKKFRAGAISATVWKNHSVKDGKDIEYRTVSLDRNYQDGNGQWSSTNSLRVNDLPKAALVLQKAFEYVSLRESPEEAAV
jgi:hypothetical protein